MSQGKVLSASLLAFVFSMAICFNAGINGTENSIGLVLFVLLMIGPVGLVISLIGIVCLMKTRFLSWAITSLMFFAVLWGSVVTCGFLRIF